MALASLWPVALSSVAVLAGAAELVRIQEAANVQGWWRGPLAPGSEEVDVVIALRNWNMDKLDREVLAVSSPSSARYGQHLRPAEVADLTSAAPGAQIAVGGWLRGAGILAVPSRWGDRLEFRATVAQVEAVFKTRVVRLEQVGRRSAILQAADLFAPAEVAKDIAAVFGLHGIPLQRPPAPAFGPLAPKVNPALLREVHQVSGVEVSRIGRNRRAVVEFHDQRVNRWDLATFFDRYVPSAQPSDRNFTCRLGDCEAKRWEPPSAEAMVDLQYLMGPVPGVETEVWSFSSMSWCADLKNWTVHVLDSDDPPLVFSIGYGVQGSLDQIQGCGHEMVANVEEDFVKIAARGVTLIFSSGDGGSGGTFGLKSKLWPAWPGSAPHATSVGATQFEPLSREQLATGAFGSGGGFSWRSKRPSWQDRAVEAFLANPMARLPVAQDFARDGRAVPDLAALGVGLEAVSGDRSFAGGGTAAAAPFFASLVSLLNEYRLQHGQSPLGFLNPLIYEMAAAGKGFADITRGGNRRDRWAKPLREGFSCTRGWDAVTGWGVPRFQDLLEYVKSLPSGRRQEEVVV